MLFDTVSIPATFDAQGDKLRSAYCYELLLKFQTNCVILDTPTEVIANSLVAQVRNWGPKYKPRALAVIAHMQKHHRFIASPITPTPDITCPTPGCTDALALTALLEPHNLVLTPEVCLCGGACQDRRYRPTQLLDYSVSPFEQSRRLSEDGGVAFNRVDLDKFTRTRVNPVLRRARQVVIVDRVFGTSVSRGVTNLPEHALALYLAQSQTLAQPPLLAGIEVDNYFDTLRWLYEAFAKVNTEAATMHICVEIPNTTVPYTGLQLTAIQVALDALAHAVKKVSHDLVMLSMVSAHHANRELPHDRYLITDQMAVNIGRGLDLLTQGGMVKDTEFKVVLRRERVVGRLQELYPDTEVIQQLSKD